MIVKFSIVLFAILSIGFIVAQDVPPPNDISAQIDFPIDSEPQFQSGEPYQCYCLEVVAPVCGSDGFTYGNSCRLACAQRWNQFLTQVHEGECETTGINQPFDPVLISPDTAETVGIEEEIPSAVEAPDEIQDTI